MRKVIRQYQYDDEHIDRVMIRYGNLIIYQDSDGYITSKINICYRFNFYKHHLLQILMNIRDVRKGRDDILRGIILQYICLAELIQYWITDELAKGKVFC